MKTSRITKFVASSALVAFGAFSAACSSAQAEKKGPSVTSGAETAARGAAHLILAPVQIAAGLLEGVAALPYFAATGLHKLNRQLNKGQAAVSIADTYQAAYGRKLSSVAPDGDTGHRFRSMRKATRFFQKVLAQEGVRHPERYILTSVDTATRKGYTLFAVVYRPRSKIEVIDKYDGKTRRSYGPSDRMYHEAYRTDSAGRRLDQVVDYAGLRRERVSTQRLQAIMLTLAANSVARNKRRPVYWTVERRWIGGAYLSVMKQRTDQLNRVMNLYSKK